MKKAVIDLGSNTFNLLIAKVKQGRIKIIKKSKIAVKIGQGGYGNKEITPSKMDSAIAALKQQQAIINKHDVNHTFAVGTSAIRDASNQAELLQKASTEGIKITVIDGDQEAYLIYKGVVASGALTASPSLIVDIGGGSIEFVVADDQQVHWSKSYNLGVSRLLEKLPTSDPILPNEIEQVEQFLDKELSELSEAISIHKPTQLTGTSGSFNSFVDIINHHKYEPTKKATCDIDLNDFEWMNERLMKSNHAEREVLDGLVVMRIDTIVLASLITNYLIKKYNFSAVVRCPYALKEGALTISNDELLEIGIKIDQSTTKT